LCPKGNFVRKFFVCFTFFFCCSVLPVRASGSAVCSVAQGASNVFTTQSCSPLFTPTATLDWGAAIQGSMTGTNLGGLGPASNSTWPQAIGTTVNAAVGGVRFTVTSNDLLTRVDNADLAWSSTFNAWVPASFAYPGARYFSGFFGGATTSTSVPATGDNLLGAVAPSGASHGSPTITLTFALPFSYVAFHISSKTNSNFTAQLLAFNGAVQLGTFQVQATGLGGNCAGTTQSPPQPCNSAPLIQFYAPAGTITTVQVVLVDDTTGMYIDSLEIGSNS
jgi:hypothetical protein